MQRLVRMRSEDAPAELLRRLEEVLGPYGFAMAEIVPLFAALLALPLPEHYPPLMLTLQRHRQTLFVPYLCIVLAEVCDHLGHTADGLQALAEAQTLVEQHEERCWETEIYRLRGVVLLRQPETPQAEAEAWLQRALDVARRQEAKSLELRAAMSLSRLWQQQGKRAEAYELLGLIYGWFTEGFDTADLQEAKVLLEELA
jgi:predicted ATPase